MVGKVKIIDNLFVCLSMFSKMSLRNLERIDPPSKLNEINGIVYSIMFKKYLPIFSENIYPGQLYCTPTSFLDVWNKCICLVSCPGRTHFQLLFCPSPFRPDPYSFCWFENKCDPPFIPDTCLFSLEKNCAYPPFIPDRLFPPLINFSEIYTPSPVYPHPLILDSRVHLKYNHIGEFNQVK